MVEPWRIHTSYASDMAVANPVASKKVLDDNQVTLSSAVPLGCNAPNWVILKGVQVHSFVSLHCTALYFN